MLNKKNLMGVDITDTSLDNVLEYLIEELKKDRKKFYLVTPNPEILTLSARDKDYKNILNNAEIALPDGVGVVLASKILGKSVKERIAGVDFVYALCIALSKQPITVGFLGGGPNVAEKTANCLTALYPGLKVAFALEEWPQKAESLSCDFLFVAFGSPKQEKWIAENLNKLPVKAAMGVGGAFDFISGSVMRAPFIIRKIGLEWLFRLILQPWRLKRQLSLVKFLFLVIKEKAS